MEYEVNNFSQTNERTIENLNEISSLIMDVKFLDQFKECDKYFELLRYLEIKSFYCRDIIFNQGDEGDAL
jgi:hypothetical protein